MELVFLAILLGLMVLALTSGYPVAFALPGSAIVTILIAAFTGYVISGDSSAYFAQDGPVEWLSAGVTNFRSLYWEVERDTLIAIPLFVFMGIMLQRSKIAEDLLVAMAQLFGPVPGGLGISVIFVGALLAATTGIVGATVIAMGLISLPAMLRSNYSTSLASGTICASGTLGQIIPPSIVLIILADQLSNAADQANTARKLAYKEATGEVTMPAAFDVTSASAGDMFMGAFLPGLVTVGLYMAYVLITAVIRPKLAPPVPYHGAYDRQFFVRIVLALIPPLALIFAVLGSIVMGVATVNQAGAIGAIGAMIMASYRLFEGRRGAYYPAILAFASTIVVLVTINVFDLNIKNIQSDSDRLGVLIAGVAVFGLVIAIAWATIRTLRIDDTLNGVMIETAKTTSMVFIILIGAAMLTSAFRAFGGEELVREYLTTIPGGFWSQFIVVMVVIFLLGFFLDYIEIAVVVVPIVAPILLADPSANITAVWLGVMIGLNIQTSFLTPPFGFSLFYLRGVAPSSVTTTAIYKGAVAFIALQLVALAIAGYWPSLVNYLPNRTYLTADTAPPPQNPRIQYCMERVLFEDYVEQEMAIRSSLQTLREMDLTLLPNELKEELAQAFDRGDQTFELVSNVEAASAAVREFTPEYRPLLTTVRGIEKRIKDIDERLVELGRDRDRRERSDGRGIVIIGDSVAEIEAKIDQLNREREQLKGDIPPEWEDVNAQFVALSDAEADARRVYRRSVDSTYEPIMETIDLLSGTPVLEQIVPALSAMPATVESGDVEETMERMKGVESRLSNAGALDAKSLLSKSRRALKGDSPDRETALQRLAEAEESLATELAWRSEARAALLPEFKRQDGMIADTIGLRSQQRLPKHRAKQIAACQSAHRDVSLNF